MTISIKPKLKPYNTLEYPNGFWVALMVDTPLSKIIESEHTDRGTIKYEHEGYVGDKWFTKGEAKQMLDVLQDYIKTDEYANHPYFKTRQGQMEMFIEFLPACGGFKFVR
jgi:hypothetical protein